MKGWRTIAVNVLTFGTALFAWDGLAQFVDPQFIIMGQAAINVALRFVTTSPVGKKETA